MSTNAATESPLPPADDERWGELFVTRRCCGAATCRNYAPELFGEVLPPGASDDHPRSSPLPGSHEEGAFTGVLRQPRSHEDWSAAQAAAAGCGFGAIRLKKPAGKRLGAGGPWREWPRQLGDGVWALGRPSPKNYGAMSYFVQSHGGGILVDMPKPTEEIFRWLEEHGGVRWLLLSHKDHVQHHAEYAARFPGLRRVIGKPDVNKHQSPFADATTDVEVQIPADAGPCTLEGEPIAEAARAHAELVVLPQPGHTPGGLCLLYRGTYLFTGDHLAYSKALGHVIGHRLQCWQSWERLTTSVSELRDYAEAGWLRFAWLLPGHGEWHRFEGEPDAARTSEELGRAVEWMRAQPPGNVPLLRWIPFVMSRSKPTGRFGRLVRAIGGAGREAWLIPRSSRGYLTDPMAAADASVRRLGAITFAGLATVTALAWILAHALN